MLFKCNSNIYAHAIFFIQLKLSSFFGFLMVLNSTIGTIKFELAQNLDFGSHQIAKTLI